MKVWAVLLLCATALAKHEIYEGWRSFYVGPSTPAQLQALGSISEQFDIDFLSTPILSREGVAIVKPQHQNGFIEALNKQGIAYRIHSDNIKAQLDYDDILIERKNRESMARNGGKSLPYDNYQELEVIEEYLRDVAERYPETVTLVEAGKSFEGRTIQYVKISTTNFEDESKPVMVIDAGIHAREWIGVPVVTWAIHKLVEDVSDSDLLERFDWILVPVANPDGYKHTFDGYRFWRKTRSTDQHILGTTCPGVDINRNFDFFWNTVGASTNPCSDNFSGSRAVSEAETGVLRDIILTYLHRIALYVSLQSYGSLVLYPWGHDGTLSNNALALHTVGIAMSDAFGRYALSHFPRYVVGNSYLVTGSGVSGSSENYAHYAGVPLSFKIELPGLESGQGGFHLDPLYIEHICVETWAGLAAGARNAAVLWVPA